MLFNQLQLTEPLLRALQQEGYTNPTPVQEKSIPAILERRDLLGCAQTGTGKTAAFALPLLQLLQEDLHERPQHKMHIKTLVLTPTRELAIQVDNSFKAYGRFLRLKSLAIFGGVSQVPQVNALHQGVDILVATPGRLLDLMNQHIITLQDIRYFVLDEADRMLDMGFIHDVKKIIAKLPAKRQTLFFSATMPPEIQKLSSSLLHQPVKVEVTPASSTVDIIEQSVYFADKAQKKMLLVHLLQNPSIESVLVFTRTKHGADKVVKDLIRAGIRAQAIHGNKSQNARQLALKNFTEKTTRVLVATDIAARGIDIDEMGYVINYELPNIPETYVHRIGRTGRAGASGIAISFCDSEERAYLKDIQKLIKKTIPVMSHPFEQMVTLPKEPVQQARPHQAAKPGGQNRFQSRRPNRNQRPQLQSQGNRRSA